MNTVAIENRQV